MRREVNDIIELSRERSRRYRIKRARQIRNRCFITVFTILLIALLSMTYKTFVSEAKDSASIAYKYYTSIEIAYGETLWDIAEDYAGDEYDSLDKYIEEVKTINHLSDDTICAGAHLIVPYFSSVVK